MFNWFESQCHCICKQVGETMDSWDQVVFFFQKVSIYAVYTCSIILPTIFAFLRFDELWQQITFGMIGGMIILHFLITDESIEARKDLAKLIMRKRHFKSIQK